MNSVRLIIKLEILTCSNELNVKEGGDNSRGMESTNPFSFYFAAGKERQRAGSSGEQCPDFNCCRGVREGRELSTNPAARDALSKQRAHPEPLHLQVFSLGRSISSGFTPQERTEVHLTPPDHTYRSPAQLRAPTSQ